MDSEPPHHSFINEMIARMRIQPRDRILDVGCGKGWAGRLLAELVPEGLVVGVDISEQMVHNARAKSAACENLMFILGEADDIPWQNDFFSKVLSVDAFYYFENAEKALQEIRRVMSPGGSLWILNPISKENELSLRQLADLKVAVHLRSAEEYGALFEQCGFVGYEYQMIPDCAPVSKESWTPTPLPGNPGEDQRFRELGALLMTARKKG